MTKSFRPHYGPGIDTASNRNEYQEGLLGGLKRPALWTDKITIFMCRLCGIQRAHLPETLRASPG